MLQRALTDGLPEGFDVLEVVPAGSPDFAERLEASAWLIELPGVAVPDAEAALAALLARSEALVERLTKSGPKSVDVRAALVGGEVVAPTDGAAGAPCAILQVVVRHVTPSVRPVDVLAALSEATGLPLPQATRICRQAQGPLGADGFTIGDPLARDRAAQHA